MWLLTSSSLRSRRTTLQVAQLRAAWVRVTESRPLVRDERDARVLVERSTSAPCDKRTWCRHPTFEPRACRPRSRRRGTCARRPLLRLRRPCGPSRIARRLCATFGSLGGVVRSRTPAGVGDVLCGPRFTVSTTMVDKPLRRPPRAVNATPDQIRGLKRRAIETHPDKTNDDGEAFKAVQRRTPFCRTRRAAVVRPRAGDAAAAAVRRARRRRPSRTTTMSGAPPRWRRASTARRRGAGGAAGGGVEGAPRARGARARGGGPPSRGGDVRRGARAAQLRRAPPPPPPPPAAAPSAAAPPHWFYRTAPPAAGARAASRSTAASAGRRRRRRPRRPHPPRRPAPPRPRHPAGALARQPQVEPAARRLPRCYFVTETDGGECPSRRRAEGCGRRA